MKMWHKLFLGFSVVITMIIAAVGYISVHISQEELQDTIGETSVALAREILNSININIERRIESIQEHSSASIISKAASESNNEFARLDDVQAYVNKKDQEWTSVPQKEITPFMQELIGNKLSRELRRVTGFYEQKHGRKVFNEIIITNKYGANIAQTGKSSDYNQSDEHWWQAAKQNGLFLEDVDYDESADVYSIAICTRIDDHAENFLGVIKAVYNIDDIIKLIQDKEHKATKFKLLTEDNRIIYATENFEFLQKLPFRLAGCLSKFETYEHSDHFIAKDEQSGEVYKLYAHAHSNGHGDYKGLGWTLLVEHDTREIFASATRSKGLILFILLVFTIFAVLVGLFISFSIYKPLVKLKNALVKIGEGRLDTRVTIKSKDEVGFLADSINKMAEDLNRTQSQLIQNEKLASIGQLAAGVAHEMNTPVGFVASNFQTLESYVKKIQGLLAMYEDIFGQIESLEKTELQNKTEAIDKARDYTKIDFILEDIQGLFDDSREGLDRVTNIIQNLRDFSRIDQAGSFDEYDLNKGIEATLVVAKNEIKYDAEVKTDFSKLPKVFCHSGQINQVLLNILVNAAQAIKDQERDDKGTINIKTYTTETEVVCEIADDGPAIPPDTLSKIFDPFFTTKPAGKGTGLGLSVSYDIIVNKHNGQLLVDSTENEGTKFTIKLPISSKEKSEKEIIKDGKEDSIIC